MLKRALLVGSLATLVHGLLPGVSLPAEYAREGGVIGYPRTWRVEGDESLPEVARRFDVGYNAIVAANPGVDPFVPGPRRKVVVPTQWILPDAATRDGIVVNVAEMRLYLFGRLGSRTVTTFPVGIGDEGKDTPAGTFTIAGKIRDPAWYVPASIRKEKPYLPAVVPPGPDNPMGSRALRLSNPLILIHGTDRPWGIGTRNSHGCIRLYEEDIARLFGEVGPGTPVTIVNQPVKAADVRGRVFLQVHDYGDGRDLAGEALRLLEARGLAARADPMKVRKATRARSGLLVDVSR